MIKQDLEGNGSRSASNVSVAQRKVNRKMPEIPKIKASLLR